MLVRKSSQNVPKNGTGMVRNGLPSFPQPNINLVDGINLNCCSWHTSIPRKRSGNYNNHYQSLRAPGEEISQRTTTEVSGCYRLIAKKSRGRLIAAATLVLPLDLDYFVPFTSVFFSSL